MGLVPAQTKLPKSTNPSLRASGMDFLDPLPSSVWASWSRCRCSSGTCLTWSKVLCPDKSPKQGDGQTLAGVSLSIPALLRLPRKVCSDNFHPRRAVSRSVPSVSAAGTWASVFHLGGCPVSTLPFGRGCSNFSLCLIAPKEIEARLPRFDHVLPHTLLTAPSRQATQTQHLHKVEQAFGTGSKPRLLTWLHQRNQLSRS